MNAICNWLGERHNSQNVFRKLERWRLGLRRGNLTESFLGQTLASLLPVQKGCPTSCHKPDLWKSPERNAGQVFYWHPKQKLSSRFEISYIHLFCLLATSCGTVISASEESRPRTTALQILFMKMPTMLLNELWCSCTRFTHNFMFFLWNCTFNSHYFVLYQDAANLDGLLQVSNLSTKDNHNTKGLW